MLKWFRRRKTEETAPEAAPEIQDDNFDEAPLVETPTLHHLEAPPELAAITESIEPISTDDIPPAAPSSTVEPPVKKSFFARMKDKLSRTRSAMVDSVLAAFNLHGKVDEELLEEIESILIQSDVGVVTAQKIVGRMRTEAREEKALDADALLALFKTSIAEILEANNRPLEFDRHRPTILLFVGVNGTGKTTTIGKIGKVLSERKKKVMMVAADTFRAAAADQLQVWAERTGSAIVRQAEGADPAAVVFEALEGAKQETPDVILIDTAGRLHTKTNLMEQLKKIRRVIQKHYPDAPHETILVLDATTGQNAVSQLKTFNEATELTGLVMTKLDGTAKGGILIACKDLSPLPVFKIGIGEQAEDLRDFIPGDFVDALFASTPH